MYKIWYKYENIEYYCILYLIIYKIEYHLINIFIIKMFLPPRALALIKEYSKPLTRPDWRTLRRLNMGHIYIHIMNNKNKYYPPVFNLFTRNIVRNYSYQYIVQAIKIEGKEKASIMLNIPIEILNTIRIIREL
jgi:hypothetical protein